jgi:hypothetical protein
VSAAGLPHALTQAWRVVGWVGVAALIVLSLVPEPPSFTEFQQEDKIGHVLAYAAIMLWFAQVNLSRGSRTLNALGLLALGVALEFVQGWTGERTFSLGDMGADAIGIALGWLAAPPRGPDLLTKAGRMLSALR